jgi:hypothetical protein
LAKVVKSANSFKAAGFAFFNKSLENVFTFSGLSFFLQAQVGMVAYPKVGLYQNAI